MKKKKLRSLIKSARKTVKNDIQENLINGLKAITLQLGQDSKKLTKDIEKGARQLAKKLAKDIKIDKAAIIEVTELANSPAETVPAT